MFQILFIATLLLIGCVAEVDIEKADYDRARRATIEAWEQIIERVTRECEKVLREASITESNEIQKKTDNQIVAGKIYISRQNNEIIQMQIHILASRNELEKLDDAVHEFTHGLAACQRGDLDSEHLNAQYWIDYGPDTVEAWGCAGL